MGASTSWNPQDLSKPVIGLLYFYLPTFPGAETWSTNTSSASQQIPRNSSNPKLHTAFTSARQLPLSWATAIQSTSTRLTSCRSVLMLSLHLSLGPTSGLFTSRHTWWLLVLVHQRFTTPCHTKPYDRDRGSLKRNYWENYACLLWSDNNLDH
jgi:hypothetical protein